jgi:hypothetical protein
MVQKKQSPGQRPVMAFRFDPELRDAMRLAAKEDRRSLNSFVQIVLETALEARGLWPPKKRKASAK